jgi:hypothetical protein
LPGVAAKLGNLLKKKVDVQRILADNAALQHHCVLRTCDIAHLAQAVDPLVGIDPDQDAGARARLDHHRIAHVGNLQRRRA